MMTNKQPNQVINYFLICTKVVQSRVGSIPECRVSSLWNGEQDEENLGTDRFLLSRGSALSQDVMKE